VGGERAVERTRDLAATPTRAPFSTVAFSRSSSPTEPISWLSERLDVVAEARRARSRRPELVPVGRRARTRSRSRRRSTFPRRPQGSAASRRRRTLRGRGRRTRSRPRTSLAAGDGVAEIGRQPKSGRTPSVAGAPMRSTATRFSSSLEHRVRRVRRASITCVMRSFCDGTWYVRGTDVVAEDRVRSRCDAAGDVGPSSHPWRGASSAPSRSRTTASVFVPPTSIPSRRSIRACSS